MRYSKGQRVRLTHGENVYVGEVVEHESGFITVRPDGLKGANTFNDWEWEIQTLKPSLPTKPGSIIRVKAFAANNNFIYLARTEADMSEPWEVLHPETLKPRGPFYRWNEKKLVASYPNWEVVYEGGFRKIIEDWKAENERPA